jgi:pimeloyl-ACP methyl ester carboxylesterase
MRAEEEMRRTAIVVAILALAVLPYAAVSVYAANEFTRTERHPNDRAVASSIGAPVEDVSFRTDDGKLLRGWFFGRGDRAVVMVHGKDGHRLDGDRTVAMARAFVANGYSVLAFDLRGHGESEGDRFSLGQYERRDVAAAVGFLEQRGFSARRVALFGESMGAGTVIQTLILRPDVGAVVADSSYTSATVEVGEHFTLESGLPSLFVPGVLVAARGFGLDASQIAPIEVVRAHPERPFLLIHCDADGVVEVHQAYDLRSASANPDSKLWVVHGCEHVRAHDAAPAEYEALVLGFIGAQIR